MLVLNLALFGTIGMAVWAVQMLWIPITAAGVINGIGHYWGYRNFEAPDASRNISPWGIIIGGEELHNNHHTYPTSAKFSVKKYEFDIGWIYISLMQRIGWAKVKKIPPKMLLGDIQPVADEKTLEAVIANRYEVMARYARGMRSACKDELAALKGKGADLSVIKSAKRWLHRDDDKVPAAMRPQLAQARAALSGARQDGHDARRVAPDVAQHFAIARAAGGGSGRLVRSCRSQRDRGAARLLDAPAHGARELTHPVSGSLRVARIPLKGATPAARQSRFRGVSEALKKADLAVGFLLVSAPVST